jgi:hypothetical protein
MGASGYAAADDRSCDAPRWRDLICFEAEWNGVNSFKQPRVAPPQ